MTTFSDLFDNDKHEPGYLGVVLVRRDRDRLDRLAEAAKVSRAEMARRLLGRALDLGERELVSRHNP